MESLIFGMLVVLAIALVAVLVRLGVLKASVDQIVPRHDVVVHANAAMAESPYTKTEVEKMILAWVAEDETIRNVSREDVRVVMHGIGEVFRGMQPDGRIGQVRDVTSW